MPHEFDRVSYVRAIHTVRAPLRLGSEIDLTAAVQEGSRFFTPVRLGFPRETENGASYRGVKIPEKMVRLDQRL